MWVYQVRNRFRQTGQRGNLAMGGHRRSRIAGMEQTIRGWIRVAPDLPLAEMGERLAGHGLEIKVPALWHQLDNWKLSFKKNPARQRARARSRSTGAA